MMNPFIYLIITILNLYGWVVIARLILHWLIHFDIVNRYNSFVSRVNYALFKLTEPLMAPIRKVLPDLGGIDISPIIVFLLIQLCVNFLINYSYSF